MTRQQLGAIILVITLIIIIIFNGVVAGVDSQKLPSGFISTVSIMNIVLFSPTLVYSSSMIFAPGS